MVERNEILANVAKWRDIIVKSSVVGVEACTRITRVSGS